MKFQHALLPLTILDEVDVRLLTDADLVADSGNGGRLALVERLERKIIETTVGQPVPVIVRVGDAGDEVTARKLSTELGNVSAAET